MQKVKISFYINNILQFIHSRPENLALQGEDEKWPFSINHNRPRLLSRGSRRLIGFDEGLHFIDEAFF